MSVFTSDVVVDGTVVVDGSAVIQPISAASLPLPAGASTEATLLAIKAKTDNIDVALSTRTKPSDSQTVTGSVSVSNFPATQPVSGSVSISNFPATQPVSGPLTDTQLRATPVPISGTVSTTPLVSNAATVAQVVLSTNTNATLLAANANRKKAIVFAPKSTLYLKFGATASSTSFTYVVVAANTTLELTNWTGQIDVLSTVNQTVNVTELI